ncbi:unnamed protein product [Staurois parvus]|uniref:Secreted protein n=1 Tax=Staurois parvus TaxID=386267 RepID=A0ABN9BL23_9NEOB|nr:unnamed protein product [Staurois parvus]
MFCLLTVLLPVSSGSLLWMAVHSTAIQCNVLTVKHTDMAPYVKHYQHTVNPLIGPHVNPFLPSAISTVSVLIFSTDHCIGVTGDVCDTKSVPPSVRMSAAILL